eukprot:TRINITY_DN122_c0_g1_i5.p1 TRINITY_DN122_c0_g1~~TRINITY_DN122_c0_g1_i5.p1  ORF type:complete len:527 (+),score=152.47 TRINITY_DN122_c0_g1_i5:80-1582(+)
MAALDSRAKQLALAGGLGLYALHALTRYYGTKDGNKAKKAKTGAQHSGAAEEAALPPKDPEAVNRYMASRCNKMADVSNESMDTIGDLGKFMTFKNEYKTRFVARPDVTEGELLTITDYKRLTPDDYERHAFHVEFDIAGTSMIDSLNGSQGAALSVYGTNNAEKVREFLKKVGIDPHKIVSIDEIAVEEEGVTALTSVEKLFVNYLDIFGRPTREFLKKLFPFAMDIQEKVAIAELTLERKLEEFQDRTARAYTFADYILDYPSLKIPVEKYIDIIPTLKQRVYSICSSTRYRPGKCQLLVVQEDWVAKGGELKFGLCSTFLSKQRNGTHAVCHPTHSVMQIPEDHSTHIFMAGLGTGLAPFRAFIEERKHYKDQGVKVGPMTLFFGGRYSSKEYYYRDEMEAFEKEGIVKCCNAWSRDTAKKVYVQHKITEEKEAIWRELGREGSKGYFFLCGSKQPEKDVYQAILEIFQEKGGMTKDQALKKMEQLQEVGRYVTEVY